MIAVIKAFPLGMLVTAIDNIPHITHIPIIYNDSGEKLIAHIDASNPQVASLKNGARAKVVFKGPDCYISPSVYSTEQLPTWNYIIVHIEGIIQTIDDPEAVKKTMIDMTAFLEGDDQKFVLEPNNPKMDRMVSYIRAFQIEITKWEGKFKLSQDKIAEDQHLAHLALLEKSREDHASFINAIYA